MQVILRILFEAPATFSCSLYQPVPQTPIDVLPDEVIGLHDRTFGRSSRTSHEESD